MVATSTGAFGEPEAKARSNRTDPACAVMKADSEGFQRRYNAQWFVGGKRRTIFATTDQGQLLPMPDVATATVGRMPEEVLADARYCSEAELAEPVLTRNS